MIRSWDSVASSYETGQLWNETFSSDEINNFPFTMIFILVLRPRSHLSGGPGATSLELNWLER
jgi:hypothetical protein